MIKVDNQSDKHLTVAGLTVLGDVQSNNLQRFEKNLQETFDKTQNLTAQQKEFWKNLADDNLITPVEKKQIKQEIAIIEKTYQALHKKAQEVGQEFNPLFTSYATAYRELKDYIIELKLFDNMNENTRVNKTEFNLKFSDYYEFENVVQSVFLGTPTYTMRVLSGLNDEGTEGEVAIYRNIFYRRENEKWVLITGDTYLGLQKSVPANGSLGDFFLAKEDFTGQIKYKARGKYLKANGKFLTSAKKFKKGFIYKLEPSGWKAIENKNDHRYVIATEDLIEIGETISLHLQKWFTDIDETLDKKIEHIPEYKGAVSVLPNNPIKDDYFTWAAESTNEYVKGKVYMWDGEAWKLLDPTDTTNNQQFMTALTDILKTNATGEGYFSTIFASALIASNAFIQNLQSQIITLQNGGRIQSENYEQGKLGFLLDSNGVFECSAGTFRGSIESGPLVLNTTSPGISTFTIPSNFTALETYNKLRGYGINEQNTTIKINGISERVKLESEETTTTEKNVIGSKYSYFSEKYDKAVYKKNYYDKTTITLKKTVKFETSNVIIEYIEKNMTYKETKFIEETFDNIYLPQKEIINPIINQEYVFEINNNATTLKLLFLPVNTGENLESGTVYVENGFLKIV